MARSEHGQMRAAQKLLLDVGADSMERATARESELAPLRQGDLVQVLQVGIGGKATDTPVHDVQTVKWPHPFLCRITPGQSTLGMDNPHFTSGVQLDTPDPVWVQAHVIEWVEDNRRLISQAKMRFSAWAPGATKQVPFSGLVHLTFTGLAAPAEDDSEG